MAGNDGSSGSDPEMEDESCSGSAGGSEWWKVVNRKRKKNNSQGSFTDSGKEDHNHITIRRGSAVPPLEQCTTCCRNFHCPFCASSIFKPSRLDKLNSHIKIHFKKAVVHGDFTFHRCGLGCRPTQHFHCLYCTATILRREVFHSHLEICKSKQRKMLSTTSAKFTVPRVATMPTTTTGTPTAMPSEVLWKSRGI